MSDPHTVFFEFSDGTLPQKLTQQDLLAKCKADGLPVFPIDAVVATIRAKYASLLLQGNESKKNPKYPNSSPLLHVSE